MLHEPYGITTYPLHSTPPRPTPITRHALQWAENAANDIKDFAVAVANAVADFAEFIWNMLTGWDCDLSGKDIVRVRVYRLLCYFSSNDFLLRPPSLALHHPPLPLADLF